MAEAYISMEWHRGSVVASLLLYQHFSVERWHVTLAYLIMHFIDRSVLIGVFLLLRLTRLVNETRT